MTASSAPSAKDVVLAAWQAFASRDPARISAVFTPDAEWLAPEGNATAVALGDTHHLVGRDRIVHFLTVEFPTVFVADVQVDFHHVIAEGNTVVVEERMQATLPHGGRYDNEYCFIFEVEEGRIHRVREHMDTRRGAACFATPAAPVAAGS
jgi:ketosteroid isomerase-like protein